jgi:hypothetical protein
VQEQGDPADPVLTLAPVEHKRAGKRGKRAGFDPSNLEQALLEQVMGELLRCRALAGFPAKRWAAGESHCTELLARLREGRGLAYALEAVRAVVWTDAKADPARLPEIASGKHATLTRIFRRGNEESPTGRIAQVARWVEEWTEAGKPEPRPASKGRGGRVHVGVEGDELCR